MSIASEITRLQNAKASIKTSIENKGVTVPSATKLDGYSTLIDSIQTGGSGEWTTDGIAQNLEPNGAITLSNTVTTVEAGAFRLRPITSISGNNVTVVKDSAFEASNIESAVFPSLVEIKPYAFRSCKLISVSFPNVTIVRTNAFQQNINTLISVSLDSWESLSSTSDTNFFYDCEKLVNVNLPKLKTINGGTFQQCYSLEFLDLPSVTKIGNNGFYNARKLATLVLRSTSVVTLDNVQAFINTPIRGYNSLSGTIYVPSALISSYQTASNWSSIFNEGHCTFSAIEGSIYE